MKGVIAVPTFLYFIQVAFCRISLEDFYPYGPGNGDTRLPRNDDSFSGPITIGFPFPYFGTDHNSIFVSIFI